MEWNSLIAKLFGGFMAEPCIRCSGWISAKTKSSLIMQSKTHLIDECN